MSGNDLSGPTLEAAQIEQTTHPKLPTCIDADSDEEGLGR